MKKNEKKLSLKSNYYFYQFLFIWFFSILGNLFLFFLWKDVHEFPVKGAFLAFLIFSLFYGALAWIGIKLTLKAKLPSLNPHKFLSMDLLPGLAGAGIALSLIYLLNKLFIKAPLEEISFLQNSSLWLQFLSAVYNGFNEEILVRLFLLSLIYFILKKLFKEPSYEKFLIWAAIIISTLIPLTLNLWLNSSFVFYKLLILHSIGGLVFGWLFVYKRFWAGVIAHFTVDFIITSF